MNRIVHMSFDSLLNTFCLLVVAFNNQAKQTRLGKHASISQLHVSHGSGWRQNCLQEVSLSLLDSRSLGGDLSSDGGSGGDGDGEGDKTGVTSDNRGVVNDVLGHMVGHVLLNSDLGHVLDGVVDVVADMLDNGGSGDGDRSGVVSGNSGSGDDRGLDRVGSDGRSGDKLGGGGGDGVGVDSRGSRESVVSGNWSRGGVVSGNRGSVDDRDDSLADGVNKAVLVEVLGESLEGERLVALGSGDQVPDGGGEGAGGGALVDVGGGGDRHLGVSCGGSEAGAQDSEEGDLRR